MRSSLHASSRNSATGRRSRLSLCSDVIPCVMLLGIALSLAGVPAAHAQKAPSSTESPQMRQLQQAVSLAEHGDAQGAMAIAQRLLAQRPNFVPALKLKGMLLEESGETMQAAVTYEQALKLAPDDTDLLLKTGIYKLASGDRQAAINLLSHCTRILPNDGDAQYYLAQAYHLNGQDDLALQAIRLSARAEPDNPAILQKYGELLCSTSDYAGGLQWLIKARTADATLPRIDYDIAWANYNLMNIADAIPYAERAVRKQPNDVIALQLLASANIKLMQWQQAKDLFERVLALRQPDADILLDLGHCDLELKDYAAAIRTLQSTLQLDPTQLLAHFYLSRAYAATGNTAEAQHHAALHHLMMEQATFVRTTANEEREVAITAQARQLLREHKEDAALQLYQQHFKGTSATLADAYVFVGKLYLFLGDTSSGLRCLHHALQLDPHVRGAHTYEGILALKQGDLNRAESAFKAELANDPNYQMAIAELGEVRYRQQQWADAAAQISRSHTVTPELLFMLSDSYFHLGKIQDANLTAELVAAYGRNNADLMQGLIQLLNTNGQTQLAQRLSAARKP